MVTVMRLLARCLSGLLVATALAFLVLVAWAPGSASGCRYAAALLLLAISTVPHDARVRRRLQAGSIALVCATVGLRLVFAADGRALTMGTPAHASSRWIDRVLDEQDLSVGAARALVFTGFLHDPDVPELPRVMRDAYQRMRDAEGATPSPVAATYLGLESPGDDDTLEIGDVAGSSGVLVFLHGYAGNFTLPCWVVSQAAGAAGFATVCPSTRWVGDWWSADGAATVRAAITTLKERGARRIVLGGLSNGGVGASLLAPSLRGSIDGLVLVSGASPEAEAPHVPVLVIQGERDAQIPAEVTRGYARAMGGRYVSLAAGHFAMLVREREAMGAITEFLRSRGGRPLAAREPSAQASP
jgi:pimeloyl-ACP methyl ester carboxylesterase